jgi:hypothetical protein
MATEKHAHASLSEAEFDADKPPSSGCFGL